MPDNDDDFTDSPEHEDWIESGGRDEDHNETYDDWEYRNRNS